MIIDSKKLILDFYKDHIENNYDITFEECNLICRSPWKFLKIQMSDDRLPKIRFRYFGVFQVYRGTAIAALKNNKIKDNEKSTRFKKLLQDYINRFDSSTK